MPVKKTAAAKPASKRTPSARGRRRRNPDHSAIAERAYYLHLEHGRHDQLENWLRAERELSDAA